MRDIDQNVTTNSREIGRITAVGGGLLLFGVLFDQFTDYVTRKSWGESRSAFLVVIGVTVTVLSRRLLPLGSVMWDFFAFAASGTPMALGQYWRFEARKARALQRDVGRK